MINVLVIKLPWVVVVDARIEESTIVGAVSLDRVLVLTSECPCRLAVLLRHRPSGSCK